MEPIIELTPAVRKYTQAARGRDLCQGLFSGLKTTKKHFLTRDYELNTVCHDICVDETLQCIATCEPTDSECVSVCLRSEIVCSESKLS